MNRSFLRTCAGCGCTDMNACDGGCEWVPTQPAQPPDVCSTCCDTRAALQTLVRAKPGSGETSPLQLALAKIDLETSPEAADFAHELAIESAIGDRKAYGAIVGRYRLSNRIDERALARADRLHAVGTHVKSLVDAARDEAALA